MRFLKETKRVDKLSVEQKTSTIGQLQQSDNFDNRDAPSALRRLQELHRQLARRGRVEQHRHVPVSAEQRGRAVVPDRPLQHAPHRVGLPEAERHQDHARPVLANGSDAHRHGVSRDEVKRPELAHRILPGGLMQLRQKRATVLVAAGFGESDVSRSPDSEEANVDARRRRVSRDPQVVSGRVVQIREAAELRRRPHAVVEVGGHVGAVGQRVTGREAPVFVEVPRADPAQVHALPRGGGDHLTVRRDRRVPGGGSDFGRAVREDPRHGSDDEFGGHDGGLLGGADDQRDRH